jgi:hypothetical protein
MMRVGRGGGFRFLAAGILMAAAGLVGAAGKPAAKPKIKLPEAVEKALAELAAEAAKIKGEARMEDMKKVMAEIVEVTKINDEQKRKLEEEVKPAVERSLGPWKEEFDTRLRPYLSNEGEGAQAMLAQWPAEQLVRSGFPGEFGRPDEDAGWKAVLKTTLTPEQQEALEKVAGERDRKLNEQIAGYLKPFVEQAREAREAALATEIEDMKLLFTLPEDRVKALEEKAKLSAERAAESMGRRGTKTLRAMQEQQRTQIMARGAGSFNAGDEGEDDTADDESSEDIWKSAITGILRSDERQRWEAAAAERADRGARALAMMFIAEMDRRVQFSTEQRAKLEPVAARTLADKARSMSKNESVSLTHATLFKAEEIKGLLDAGQWTRWEAAGRGEFNGRNSSRRGNGNAAKEDKEDEPAAEAARDLPDDETLYAMHFEKRLADKRREMAGAMEARVDDVRRVVRLAPDRAKYLEIAGKGAVEHALDAWRSQFDAWVRNSVQGVKGETLRKRLAGLDNDNVWFGEEGTPGDHAVWKDALAEALSAEQKKAWDEEVAAREGYRQRAYAWGILAELNRRYRLSNDQFGRLEPLVESAVAEYFEDFTNMFGRASSTVMPRYIVTLFAAVPEDKAQAIFNAPQWRQWKDNDFKQVSGWWESMKNNHRSRSQRK